MPVMTEDLFGDVAPPARPDPHAPLAERMRPRSLEEIRGQEHLTGPERLLGRVLSGAALPSLVLWGPPGSGKTTLARLVAEAQGADFIPMSAVSAGVKEIRSTVETARRRRGSKRTVLFLDEIHRFNKAQQDALLPHVESGLLTLIGATTENPSFEVNPALLSRCRVLVLKPLGPEALGGIFDRAIRDRGKGFGDLGLTAEEGFREALVEAADGDARRMLNALEVAVELARSESETGPLVLTLDHAREALQTGTLRYDRAGEEHFNLISALHKSVRAGDAQAAVYWTERMVLSGEDPMYIARRLVRMAVEDIGLADPAALPQAMAARDAVHFLGLPEGGAALIQAAVYLALAPKSNRVVEAEGSARKIIEETGSLPVPMAFRNAVTGLMKNQGYGEDYVYDHAAPDAVSGQEGLPESLRGTEFYRPSPRGHEAELSGRMKRLLEARRRREEADEDPGDAS